MISVVTTETSVAVVGDYQGRPSERGGGSPTVSVSRAAGTSVAGDGGYELASGNGG